MPRSQNVQPKMKRPKRVTMRDIAKVAGVHVMTVSDALNDTRSVAPATREKIKRIARELNYVPNFAARALVTGRTGIVAVLSGAMNEPYYANMVHWLETPMIADGYKLMLLRTQHEVRGMLDATANLAVDGAIAIDMYHLVEEFRSHAKVPLVSIGSSPRNFVDNVVIDLSAGATEALNIMVAAGRKRVAYIVTTTYLSEPTEKRARAYLDVMEKAGQKPEIVNLNSDVFNTVRQRFEAYIQENGCPDGIFCQNDETAMIVYRVCRQAGFRVPEDVMLLGCDGQPHMDYFDTPLSTIVQPMEEMCGAAWRFLRERMADPTMEVQHVTLEGKLVVRESLRGE